MSKRSIPMTLNRARRYGYKLEWSPDYQQFSIDEEWAEQERLDEIIEYYNFGGWWCGFCGKRVLGIFCLEAACREALLVMFSLEGEGALGTFRQATTEHWFKIDETNAQRYQRSFYECRGGKGGLGYLRSPRRLKRAPRW